MVLPASLAALHKVVKQVKRVLTHLKSVCETCTRCAHHTYISKYICTCYATQLKLNIEHVPKAVDWSLQDNTSLRDELSMSKSTILHLIHELNEAKASGTKDPVLKSAAQGK